MGRIGCHATVGETGILCGLEQVQEAQSIVAGLVSRYILTSNRVDSPLDALSAQRATVDMKPLVLVYIPPPRSQNVNLEISPGIPGRLTARQIHLLGISLSTHTTSKHITVFEDTLL